MRNQTIKLTKEQLNQLHQFKEDKECGTIEITRIQAILLVDDGSKPHLIKSLTGYNQKYAFDLRRKYLKHGIDSLKERKKRSRALLTKGQRIHIIETIRTTIPRAFGFEVDYWTTSILGHLIKLQYNVQYKSKTSLYLFFKEAKFSYHKPDKQYKNRNQKVIDEWIEKNKSVIQEALQNEKTIVLVEDEMMLSTQTTTQKIWLPQGEFPKIDVSSKRKLRCVYGFLNIKNGHQHAFKTMRANSEESCKMLDNIGKIYKDHKIVIIWDNASWHKSDAIKEFLAKTKHNFFLIQFPPYAPDLNPQEHVWKAGRTAVTHNHFIENIDKATDQFVQYLNNQTFDYKFLN